MLMYVVFVAYPQWSANLYVEKATSTNCEETSLADIWLTFDFFGKAIGDLNLVGVLHSPELCSEAWMVKLSTFLRPSSMETLKWNSKDKFYK